MTIPNDVVITDAAKQPAQTVTPKAEGVRSDGEETPCTPGADATGIIPPSAVWDVIGGRDTAVPGTSLSEDDRQLISRQLMQQHLEEENESLRATVQRLEKELSDSRKDGNQMSKVSAETESTELGTIGESEARSTLTGDSKSWFDKWEEMREVDRQERKQLNL